jgi:hypothetical protein
LEEQEVKLMHQLQAEAGERNSARSLPLTCEILRREMGDRNQFKNRRQVFSDTGLCPDRF